MVFGRKSDRELWLETLGEMAEGFGVVVHCCCIAGWMSLASWVIATAAR